MSYTPVELRHVHVARSLLETPSRHCWRTPDKAFETVWRERGELADHPR